MSSTTLSPLQSNALFDILTHHEAYAEFEAWKSGDLVRHESARDSLSPLIQRMFKTFALTLPSIKAIPDEFWQNKAGDLLANLSDAELSESYDKGNLGTRKTFTTLYVRNRSSGLSGKGMLILCSRLSLRT